jgi:hypothetical protein
LELSRFLPSCRPQRRTVPSMSWVPVRLASITKLDSGLLEGAAPDWDCS